MPDPRNTPDEILPTEDGTALRIAWEDGHESIYLPYDLRLVCPCARCVDELTGRRTLTPEMLDDGVYPEAIEYVGRYALRFFWSDGHNTGIYPFDYLRGLCGCAECSTGEGE